MLKNIYLIIRREYFERVQRKSFIVSTLLTPIFLIAMMAMPALMVIMSTPENKTVAVIDNSNIILPTLAGNTETTFVPTVLPLDSAKNSPDYDAVLVIGSDVVDNPSNIQFYSHEASSMQSEQLIVSQIASAIENQRLLKYNIANLDKILQEIKVDVQMQSFRLDENGETETSATAYYIISVITIMMLYMFILLYGQMVMTSIIEEKNNRVLEVVVSSVKPTYLMLGKIVGIGCVALTQMIIWGALIYSFASFVLPLLTADIAGSNIEALSIINSIGDVSYIMSVFGTMTVLMMLGYLFYSSIYAAIGAAVDNIQDASQLQSFAIVPIIAGLIFSMSAATDPNSQLAFWLSIIPFTSPMVMMARVPAGVPFGELILSIAILAISVFVMIWLSAKIYRIGIFMYGKKPTIKDLIRWAKYK